jgi:3-hydroxyacyl-CoA dehydrogenase
MPVTIEPRGDLALVIVDNPPVNATSQAVRAGLLAAAERLDADPAVRGVVLSCRGRTFIAGGDVTEFDRPPQEPHLPDLVARIEAAATPWLAAIHGSALGGGLEIALGCRWRVALADAALGTPEVNLGLIPGAGATVRLPRLVALPLAAELLALGRPIPADRAHGAGLLDGLVEAALEAGALAFLRAALARPWPPRTLDRPPPAAPAETFWAEQRAAAARRHPGQSAPGLALDALRAAVERPAAEALAQERRTHLALRQSAESRALRHVFFAERAAQKPPVEAAPGPLERAGVIGGGTMGTGIAVAFLDAGLPVTLIERDAAALERGLAAIRRIYEGAIQRGRLAAAASAARLERLAGATDLAALADSDVVVEAVFEDLAVKRQVFAGLDAVCKSGALLATNTSYIDPNAIAAATRRPEAVLGLHFFSPANVMRLLEVVRTDKAAPAALATAWAIARRLGKTPVLAGVCDGFIGNRILKVYRREAERLLLAGLAPQDVDRAMRAFGMPMGPFEMQDLAGHDIAAAMRAAARARGQTILAPVSDRLVAAGRLGQKAGGGWYDYHPGARNPEPSAAVAAIRAEEAARAGLPAVPNDAATIQRRILYPMVDEAACILAEGIAQSPAAIDLVEILGFGFPRWRGGLMHWAAAEGYATIAAALDRRQAAGEGEGPSAALRRLAATSR